MNKDSIEIIRNTIKPSPELIEKTKNKAQHTRTHKNHIPALIAACLAIVICAAFIATTKNDDYQKLISTKETTENSKLIYSELISYREQTDLNISGYHSTDIASFNENHLKECVAIIEGEVLSVKEKEYTIVYEYDKFDTNTLTEKTNTLIYEIKIEKVWYGNIKENEIITVQDEIFASSGTFSLAEGGTYVLPLYDSGEDIRIDMAGQKYLSGETKRESKYSTLYPFHPQIEKTDSGYLFTADWKTLVAEETKEVTVDVPLFEEYYADKLRLNSEDVFERQFEQLLIETGLTD